MSKLTMIQFLNNNGTEIARIHNNVNIGIGQTDPQQGKLEINASTTTFGLHAVNTAGAGAYLDSDNGVALELGGSDSPWGVEADDAVIRTQANQAGSDLILVANDAVAIRLDDDDNSTSTLGIHNGAGSEIFTLDEGGNLRINSLLTLPALGASGSNHLCRNASNQVSPCSSSKRY